MFWAFVLVGLSIAALRLADSLFIAPALAKLEQSPALALLILFGVWLTAALIASGS